jgi:hypothetical protein
MAQIVKKFIKDAAIDENKLASSALSSTGALTGGSGTKLTVNVDGTTIDKTGGNTLEVKSGVFVTTASANSAGGYPQLDGSGKIGSAQLPSTVLQYQGLWDPSTNTPTLADATGTNGYVYQVSVDHAGVISGLGNSTMHNFLIGNLIIFSASVGQWEQTTPAAGVSSVNGAQGSVTVDAINQLTNDVTTTAASGSQSKAATVAAIQGTTVSGTTGSGNVVFSASPTLSGTLNGSAASFSSTIAASNFSGTSSGSNTGDQTITLTSDVTGSGTGSFAATIAAHAVTNGKLAQAPAHTLKGNNTGGTADVADLTVSDVQTLLAIPTSGSPLSLAAGGTGTSAASANAAFNALSPMTTAGQIIYEDATPKAAALGIGLTGQVLTVVAGLPAWASSAAAPTLTEDILSLTNTDITNQYKDLLHSASGTSAAVNSISLNVVGGPEQQKTVDYTVSLTGGSGGVTRISFAGDLATGGAAALAASDILMVKYTY